MRIFVTGGGGYVGSVLVPKLLALGHHVTVLDLFLFGDTLPTHPQLVKVKGDIRNQGLLKTHLRKQDAVIHLACISNDPSFELDPALGKAINYDAFHPLVDLAKRAGVSQFIYASSSSVYGVREEEFVTEELPLTPLTDYSRYKALCEDMLLKAQSKDFAVLVLRPATLCGYAPRLRLDLVVNVFTKQAMTTGTIRVFGGDQHRPNLHIDDMAACYAHVLTQSWQKAVYNVGAQNYSLQELAEAVRIVTGAKIAYVHSDDARSYRISSVAITRHLGFVPACTVKEAVLDLAAAFKDGRVSNPDDAKYYNIRTMQDAKLV